MLVSACRPTWRLLDVPLHLGPRTSRTFLISGLTCWCRRVVRLCVRKIYISISGRKPLMHIFDFRLGGFGVGGFGAGLRVRLTHLFIPGRKTFHTFLISCSTSLTSARRLTSCSPKHLFNSGREMLDVLLISNSASLVPARCLTSHSPSTPLHLEPRKSAHGGLVRHVGVCVSSGFAFA
jgi:hypothetical protein